MGQYIGSQQPAAMGAVFSACSTAEALIPKLTRDYSDLRSRIGSWEYDSTTTKGQSDLALMQVVGKDMETWVASFLAYAKSFESPIPGLSIPGRQIHTPGDCQAITNTLVDYETNLANLAIRYRTISGLAVPDSMITPAGTIPGAGDSLVNLAWSLLRVGAAGLAIWYGGKYLYNYLDKATLYPKDQLPRYAGGSRKATRRRKRR